MRLLVLLVCGGIEVVFGVGWLLVWGAVYVGVYVWLLCFALWLV